MPAKVPIGPNIKKPTATTAIPSVAEPQIPNSNLPIQIGQEITTKKSVSEPNKRADIRKRKYKEKDGRLARRGKRLKINPEKSDNETDFKMGEEKSENDESDIQNSGESNPPTQKQAKATKKDQAQVYSAKDFCFCRNQRRS